MQAFLCFQVKKSRGKGGFAGPDGIKSVFGQMAQKMGVFGSDSLMLPHRIWKVKFVGELWFCLVCFALVLTVHNVLKHKSEGSVCVCVASCCCTASEKSNLSVSCDSVFFVLLLC